jgi:tetratricopeptide (TPR) repeat protein
MYDIQLRFKRVATMKPSVVDAEVAAAPKKAQQSYLKAHEAAVEGKHQDAVEKFLQAIDECPDFALAHAELGLAYMNLNELEKSDEHLSIALKLKPGSYDPTANRGIVLARLKKFAEAESLLRDALRIKDDSAVVHLYLGRALAGQKRLDEAEPEFQAAITMGGTKMVEAHRALANLHLQRGEDLKAISDLETYLAANPAAPDASKIRDTVKQIKDSLKESRKP